MRTSFISPRIKGKRILLLLQAILVVNWLLVPKSRAESADDTAAGEVIHAPLFPQPLVWVGSVPPLAESQTLLDDINVFRTSGIPAGFAALEQFIAQYPNSAWTPALQVSLAEHDRASGRYLEALNYWEAAWDETKNNPDVHAKKLAVRAMAGWTRLLASLGQKQQLEKLFAELTASHLPLGVYSTEIEETKEGLATMNTDPGRSYRCGSYALAHLAMALGLDESVVRKFFMTESPDGGFTVSRLLTLAKTNGLEVEAVHRPLGASLVIPSIVHWKLNHYAAIMGETNGHYLVEDPTFEHRVWMDGSTINAEASGIFIMPKTNVPAGWQELSPSECRTNYGKGAPAIFNDAADTGPRNCPPYLNDDYEDSSSDPPASNDGTSNNGIPSTNCPPNSGMPQWFVTEPYITVWLKDIPLLYHESYNRWMQLKLSYSSRGLPQTFTFFGFGNRWAANCSGIMQTVGDTGDSIADFEGGGGEEDFRLDGTRSYKTARGYLGLAVAGGDPPALVSPTGSTNIYGYVVGWLCGTTNYFLTQRRDRYGRILEQSDYQTVSGIVYMTDWVDMDGQTNFFAYTNTAFPSLITSITDRYGRTAHFYYDDDNAYLTNIVDAQGMSTSFQYNSDDDITNMITLYGTTSFTYNDMADTNQNNTPFRTVTITEPSGDHQLYAHPAAAWDSTVPFIELVSYHWNRAQYQTLSAAALTNVFVLTNCDYENASVKMWLQYYLTNSGDEDALISDTLAWSADAYDPVQGNRPNQILYGYPGESAGKFTGSSSVPNSISEYVGDDIYDQLAGITVNSLDRLTSYTNFNSYLYAVYSNFYDPSGMILQYETGPQGELTRGYGYDSVIPNLLVSVTNAVGDVIRYTHDTNTLKVTSVIFPGGMVETNIYYINGPYKGFLEMQADIGYRTNYFSYTNGNLSVETNELGLVTVNTYDNLNRLLSTTYPDGTTTSNVYDKLDIVATKDRLNQWTYYDYNSVRQLVAVTNADGQATTFDYCGCGAPDEINQWNGTNLLVTLFDYNNNGLLTNALYPDGYDLSYTYDMANRVTDVTDSSGYQLSVSWYQLGLRSAPQYVSLQLGGSGLQLLGQQFDIYGHIVESEDRNSMTVTNGYDLVDRLVSRQYLGSDSVTDSGLETFGYNSLGLTNYIDQLGHSTAFARDLLGRVTAETNANGEILHFGYNPADELVSLTDGKNQTTTWNYDSFGRATNKVDASATVDFIYQYDGNDRLTNRWTPAKGTTVYRYDPLGNLTNVDYSAGSTTTPSLSYFYDPLNRLTNMVDGIGSTAFTWTLDNQLASEAGPWPEDTVSYSYNTSRQRASMTLLQPNASPWTQTYGYDFLMRLASVVSPAGGNHSSPVGKFDYSYSGAMAQPNQITRPTQNSFNEFGITYDALARSTACQLYTPLATPELQYSYDAGSEVTQQVFAAGNFINYAYDNIGQVKSANGFESSGSTPRLQEQFGYAYDAAWNLNERTNNALVQTFVANNVNELTNVSRSGTLTVAGTATALDGNAPYYVNGGVTNVTVNSQTANIYGDGTFAATGFTPVSGNNTYTAIAEDNLTPPRLSTNSVTAYLPTSGNLTNDSNGNLTSDGTRHFAYDDENQLIAVWVANTWSNSFAYDGLLRKRIEKDYSWSGSTWQETNEVRYVYDGNLVFQERDANNAPLTTYTRGIDLSGTLQGAGGIGGLLARSDRQSLVPAILTPEYQNPQGVVNSYYSYDANGNVATLASPYGMLLAQYEYDPFGNMVSMSGLMASMNKYRLSTREWNHNSGLYCYEFRFYDPNLQRWLNKDPIDEAGGINLYGFLENMPVGQIDPYGLFLFGLYDSWEDYVSDVGSVLIGETKGAGANLSLGLYKPCYGSELEKQGGGVGDDLATVAQIGTGVGGLAQGLTRGALREGVEKAYAEGTSMAWKNVRQRLGYHGIVDKDQQVHHWLIPQASKVPNSIKNLPFNLMPISDDAHKLAEYGNTAEKLWYGTPGWAGQTVGGFGYAGASQIAHSLPHDASGGSCH